MKKRVLATISALLLLLVSVIVYLPMHVNAEPEGEENILQNGDFADSDVSMWGAEQGGSNISTATSDTPIYDDVKTYGVINKRTRPYDCFAYDVTDLVENGSTYAFSFYVKLSDDYKGAPETQRQVDFAPYITSGGETNYLGSYSPNIQGDSSQQLTVGEWTKYEGTFKVMASGKIDKLVIRILEQGENYGEGDCVMGEYYVTGVKLVDLHLNKPTIEGNIPPLKDKFTEDFGDDMICGTSLSGAEINDEVLMSLVAKHFNSVTLGNELKPDAHLGNSIRGTETAVIDGKTITVPKLDFSQAERYLDYFLKWNEEHPESQFKIRGHVLVWHSQTPEWFFREDYNIVKPFVEPEVMNLREEWYIKTILEHYTGEDSKYKDLFYGWDVVNEAISDSTGTYRTDTEGSNWWAVYHSNEFIVNAFKYANKYAPEDLELYYNDYNDCTPDKVKGIVNLLNDVLAVEGTRIDAMGMQGHYDIDYPSMEQFEDAAKKYSEVVGKIMVTELDFKSSSAYDGTEATLPGEYIRQAYRYKALYDTMKKLNDEKAVEVGGFIVWGVIDGNSWLQAFTGVGGGVTDGSPQCPLLFDDNYHAKPAYWAIVDASKLSPEIKAVSIKQTVVDDFSQAEDNTFGNDNTNVTFKTIWNKGQVQFAVDVADSTDDASDTVKVYFDKHNSKTSGIATKCIEVKRSEATDNTADGYKVTVNVPAEDIDANMVVAFDIVVTNDGEDIAFNDTKYTQANSSEYYAEGLLKPFMFIPKATITVDGELDDAWKDAVEVSLNNKTDNPQASGKFKVLWDETNLYVYAEVTDSDLNKDSGEVHEQDSVEVFIDETNSKALEYNDATKQYRINYENEHSFNGNKCVEENETTFAKTTDTGYIVEAAFKWTEVTPKEGDYIGIELQINDADSTGIRIGTATWNDTTNQCWSNPQCYGTALLVNKLSDVQAADSNGSDADNSKRSKVGLIIGVGSAAVLAVVAGIVSIKGDKNEEKAEESKAEDTKAEENKDETKKAEETEDKKEEELKEEEKEESEEKDDKKEE
ncbi:MAG: endo-1,4-beta-xylanase [Lachnospiraceae bacterium]|nr:endo-1,4-beta-xylanase [Lachnospiraceae bacterium]